MCRISVIKGRFSTNASIATTLGAFQKMGGNLEPEICRIDDLCIVLNRFDVTTESFPAGSFPLQNDRYILAFNGEVYASGYESTVSTRYPSDVHFAMEYIERQGVVDFFREADLEGTFVVYDKRSQVLHVFSDQLSTKGCFFVEYKDSILIAQETAVLHQILKDFGIEKCQPILSLKRGQCLSVFENGKYSIQEYKPAFKAIWPKAGELASAEKVYELQKALRAAVENRIPKAGRFGVLCSGGVDSSIILKLVVDALAKSDELDRLTVFTLGAEHIPLPDEDNDLVNALLVLESLSLDPGRHLERLYIVPEWRDYLLRVEVFGAFPRLVTPNPVRTQVRHTVGMACVLAQAVLRHPEIKVMLSGDFADEIFAGYNSMHNGNIDDVPLTIQNKLDDLHLNDGARVTLASLRGCKLILEKIRDRILPRDEINCKKSIIPHPIEIRTPYASPLIAKVLQDMPNSMLIGEHEQRFHSKFVLRLVAVNAGLPARIAWRRKIPFYEGGTGIKNASEDEVEQLTAKDYYDSQYTLKNTPAKENHLERLGIDGEIGSGECETSVEYNLYHSAMRAGLANVLAGNTFRDKMPDSIYSSEDDLVERYAGGKY